MSKNVKFFVEDYFHRKFSIEFGENDNLDFQYLDHQILTSVDFVEMISIIEDYFDIQFSESDFNSEKIKTLSGLISIIENLLRNQAPTVQNR